MRCTPIYRTRLRFRAGFLFAATTASILSGPSVTQATQQLATWAGGSGDWSVSAKWLDNNLPNNGTPEDCTYAVVIPGSPAPSVVRLTDSRTIDQLTITPNASLAIINAGALTFAPDDDETVLRNAGTLTLSTVSPVPRLQFTTSRATLVGGGSLVLMGGELKSANASLTFINEDNRIQGSGSISGMNFINRGSIEANRQSLFSLYAANPPADAPLPTFVNSGTIRATTGSTLAFNKAIYNNFEGATPGRIIADGGTVELRGVTLNGGELIVRGAGNMLLRGQINAQVTNSSTGTILLTNRLSGSLVNPAGGLVALEGKFTLTLDAQSTYHNAGTFISATPLTGGAPYGGSIRLSGGPVTFTGGGSLVLDSDRSRIESDPASPGSLLLRDQTLSGHGQVTAPIVNLSTIQADQPATTLQCRTITNFGTLKAINNATLLANSLTNYGVCLADGGTLQFYNATVTAPIVATNGGTLISSGHIASSSSITLTRGGALQITHGFTRADDFAADATSRLELAGNTLELTGDFSFAMTDNRLWQMTSSVKPSRLAMIGGIGATPGNWTDWASLEVGGTDLGNPSQLPTPPLIANGENFSLPELFIGPGAHINLVDLLDNGNRAGPAGYPEALYVGRLTFADDTALLNLNGLHLYYDQLLGSPTQLLNYPILNHPVPEPTTLALLTLTLPPFLLRRRPRSRSSIGN